MIRRRAVRRLGVPAVVAAGLLLVYGATLAPDVTFWDAGEFIAAAASFGIPHPPGTPLYVLVLRAILLPLHALGVPVAVATSLVSALGTAAACALGAMLVARATGDRVAAIAGGLAAGTMSSVWLNATETEVYAASLALSLAIVCAADRAGRLRSTRWTMLTGYLVVLAVPLHLSALLAAPAAMFLVIGGARPRVPGAAARVATVGASGLAAYALGSMTLVPALVALSACVVTVVLHRRLAQPASAAPVRRAPRWTAAAVVLPLSVALAASALLVLLVRARHDPLINQGNPSTWTALVDVVARRQYAVAAPWPRQAPLWLQLGNVALYADWQVALSLGPTIFPTLLRTGATLLFVALAAYGAAAHYRRDRRTALAVGLLLASGTVGAALYLNLKAGPSFGHGVLAPGAVREARERDYFFVLGWWGWGLWAGAGSVAAARRLRVPAGAGLALAAMPLALNWQAVDRSARPEAALPRATADAMLGFAPARAVLFVAGDNDTYPLWFAQQALGLRRDVTVITTPLLPADWYRDELSRRQDLLPRAPGGRPPVWSGRSAALRDIAANARRMGRPLATAISTPAADRALVGGAWTMRGPIFVARDEGAGLVVDSAAAARWDFALAARAGGRRLRASTDGTSRYMLTLLQCPRVVLAALRDGASLARADSLAPHCNLR